MYVSKRINIKKKTTLLFYFPLSLPLHPPPLLTPPSACLGNYCTTKIHRQLQLLPLS